MIRTVLAVCTILTGMFAYGMREHSVNMPVLPQVEHVPVPMRIQKTLHPYAFRKPIIRPATHFPSVTADAVFIYDVDSNEVLFERNADEPHVLASITKLAIAKAVLDMNPDLDKIYTVTNIEEVNGVGSQVAYPGDRLTLRDAFAAMMISSDNLIAANMLIWFDLSAKDISNEYETISLVESSGLNELNLGSARETTRMARAAWKHPSLAELSAHASYYISINDATIKLTNTNPLLIDDTRWRMTKTGYIPQSGGNVVTERISTDGHAVMVGIFGALDKDARFEDLEKIGTWIDEAIVW